MRVEKSSECFGVGIHAADAGGKVARVLFHYYGVEGEIFGDVVGSEGFEEGWVVPGAEAVEDNAGGGGIQSAIVNGVVISIINTHQPPRTLHSPLKDLLKLVQVMSAYFNASTLAHVPTVSSITNTKSYSMESRFIRLRSGVVSMGFPGVSQ